VSRQSKALAKRTEAAEVSTKTALPEPASLIFTSGRAGSENRSDWVGSHKRALGSDSSETLPYERPVDSGNKPRAPKRGRKHNLGEARTRRR
jgi:hypothetical protein